MRLITITMLLCGLAFGDAVMTSPRSVKTFRLDSSSSNVPATPGVGAGSMVLDVIGNAQHLMICSEITSRIRVNWTSGNSVSAPGKLVYNMIIPAAASSSFNCFTADDIQLSQVVYIWSDSGSALSSGLVYGATW